MRGIHCWGLSTASVQLLAESTEIPRTWFQFKLPSADGSVLRRVAILDLSDTDAVLKWMGSVVAAYLTPVLLLSDLEECPVLHDGASDVDELLTVRIGAAVPQSVADAREVLASPDSSYFESWAAFVGGVGRRLPSPIAGSLDFAVIYTDAVSKWREQNPDRAAAAASTLGHDFERWEGPPLCLEDFRLLPRRVEGRRQAFDLIAQPGAAFIHDDIGWSTTGLLPRIEVLDPDRPQDFSSDRRFLRKRLEERLDAISSVRGSPKRVLGEFDAYFVDSVAPPVAAEARSKRRSPPPEWILRSVDSQPWELRVYSPKDKNERNPMAKLDLHSDDDLTDVRTLRLAFVYVDSEETWAQRPREFVLNLARHGRETADSVLCTDVRPDGTSWRFLLPALRFLQDPAVSSNTALCVGIRVSTR